MSKKSKYFSAGEHNSKIYLSGGYLKTFSSFVFRDICGN